MSLSETIKKSYYLNKKPLFQVTRFERSPQIFIKSYAIAAGIMLVIDIIWLAIISRDFYRTHIGHLLSPKANINAATIFYIIFILGLVIFAIIPAIEKHSVLLALMYGALFGFCTYATYDLTNQATLKEWPVIVTIVDLAWGTFLSSVVAAFTYLAVKL